MRKLTRANWTTQSWRNGKGTTNEVIRADDEHGFLYRISVADIGESSIFSEFKGVDRIIVQVDGAPLTLKIADTTVRVRALGLPHVFAGETPVYCEASGQARDLNVMTRRGEVTATMERLTNNAVLEPPPGARSLVFVAKGRVESPVGTLESDALLEVTAGEVAALTVTPESVLYRIDIRGVS